MNPRFTLFLLAAAILVAGEAGSQPLSPIAVSPGSADGIALTAQNCPSFSWGAVEGASRYELAVYALPDPADPSAEPTSVLGISLPGSALSWTPSVDRCLDPGGEYLWLVRAVGDTGEGEWSESLFFQVTAAPSAAEVESALALLRRYLGDDASAKAGRPAGAMPGPEGTDRTLFAPKSAAAENGEGAPAKVLPVGTSAIRGEMPATTGVTYGVEAISNSAAGAGLAADNTAGGPDLLLAGTTANLAMRESGIDVASSGAQTFTMGNSGAGSFSLDVDGAVEATSFTGDGSGLTNLPASAANDVDCAGCVHSADIADNSITGADVQNASLSGTDIMDNSLSAADLASDSVTASELATGAVVGGTGGDVLDNSITGADVANDSLTASDLAANSVGASELATSAVVGGTGGDILDNSITSADIANGSITGADVASSTLTSAHLLNEAGLDFVGGDQSIFLPNADYIVRSVALTAPAAGRVMVMTSGYFDFNSTLNDIGYCSITTGTTVEFTNLIVAADIGSSGDIVPFAGHRTYSVSSGTTIFRLVCRGVAGTVYVGDTQLTALYVPTTY